MAQANKEKDSFSVASIINLVRTNWYWFAISLVFCMGLGVLKILRSPEVYTRSAKVLIQDDTSNSTTAAFNGAAAGLDFMSQYSNIYNELALFQSPDVMEEVVKRLDLNRSYQADSLLRRVSLYGAKQPIKVDVDSLHQGKGFSFVVKSKDGVHYELTKMKQGKVKYRGSFEGTFGKPEQFPVGTITITKTPAFAQVELPLKVYFSFRDTYSAALDYCEKVKSNVKDQKSSIIELSYVDQSTKRGDDILNTLIDVYNQRWVEDKNIIAFNTAKFINIKLHDIESELDLVDNNISDYKSANLLPDVASTSNRAMDQATKANDAILDLNNRIYMARYTKDYVASMPLNQTMPVTGFESSALTEQISNYNKKVLERNNLVAVSSESNPVVVDMDNSLKVLRNGIESSINNDLVTLREQLRSQEKYQNEAISQVASNPEQAKYLLSVERQQKVKESLYLYLLQKREENDLSRTFATQNAHIIQAPNGESKPTGPNRKMILMVSFVMGLALPYLILMLRDKLVTTIRDRKDIADISVPLLGELPLYVPRGKRKPLSPKLRNLFGKKKPDDTPTVVVEKGSRNVINESFRILRTNLSMTMGKDSSRNVVSFTSFNPGSGKSFISMNLGMTFAFKDKKVLVIDCDLRHGSVSQYVDNPFMGLVDYLLSDSPMDISKLIVEYPGLPQLHVLPLGKIPPNPTELLENGRLNKLVEEVKKEYDLVFLDCPPINLVADTQIINENADRTVFVVRVGLFERDMVPELQDVYEAKAYRNMSLILNGVPTTAKGGASGHNYYYYVKD